jgi:hypothetical protein
MRNLTLFTILICVILASGQFTSFAQNAPVSTAAIVGNAVPGTIDVPLTVTGFTSIGAVSLSIDYDYSVLHFTGGTPNALLSSFPTGDQDLATGYHRITMGWFGTTGVSLPDGSTIMTLHFTYINGISTLTWYDNGPSCEFTDANYNVLNDTPTADYYINGYVCGAIATPGPITGIDTVCQGQTGEAYSIAPLPNATGYNWTVPPGAIIVTGQGTNYITVDFPQNSESGTVSVYGTNFCGNGPSAELAISVGLLPVANAGNDTIIPYGTSTLLHAASGGPGTFSYHWSPEVLLIDPDVQNPQTVNLTLTTLFTVLVTNLSTLCNSSDVVMVTITGGPLSINPTAMPALICQGESSQLYSNAGGGSGNYTYQWTSDPPGSPPWSSTLANPVVSPDSSRHYLLTVYDGFNTVSGSDDLIVSSLPSAVISGGDTLCGINATTTLEINLTGLPPWSFTYSYGSTSVYISGVQTSPYYIIASDPGDYTITAMEDANCSGSSSGTAIVRKYPIPATPEITVYGYELISSSCCGNQWYMNDAAIPGATGPTYYASVSGRYYVIVTLNSCSSDTSEVVDLVVGISENSAASIVYYPNPAKTSVTIQTTGEKKLPLKVTLFSPKGIIIKEYYLKDEANLFSIDISDLASGLYFLMFSGNDINSVGKLIVH